MAITQQKLLGNCFSIKRKLSYYPNLWVKLQDVNFLFVKVFSFRVFKPPCNQFMMNKDLIRNVYLFLVTVEPKTVKARDPFTLLLMAKVAMLGMCLMH